MRMQLFTKGVMEINMHSRGNLFLARRTLAGLALLGAAQIAVAQAADSVLVKRPAFERAADTQFELRGVMADYLRAVTRNWLLDSARRKSGHA